jgi:hypothetical protein
MYAVAHRFLYDYEHTDNYTYYVKDGVVTFSCAGSAYQHPWTPWLWEGGIGGPYPFVSNDWRQSGDTHVYQLFPCAFPPLISPPSHEMQGRLVITQRRWFKKPRSVCVPTKVVDSARFAIELHSENLHGARRDILRTVNANLQEEEPDNLTPGFVAQTVVDTLIAGFQQQRVRRLGWWVFSVVCLLYTCVRVPFPLAQIAFVASVSLIIYESFRKAHMEDETFYDVCIGHRDDRRNCTARHKVVRLVQVVGVQLAFTMRTCMHGLHHALILRCLQRPKYVPVRQVWTRAMNMWCAAFVGEMGVRMPRVMDFETWVTSLPPHRHSPLRRARERLLGMLPKQRRDWVRSAWARFFVKSEKYVTMDGYAMPFAKCRLITMSPACLGPMFGPFAATLYGIEKRIGMRGVRIGKLTVVWTSGNNAENLSAVYTRELITLAGLFYVYEFDIAAFDNSVRAMHLQAEYNIERVAFERGLRGGFLNDLGTLAVCQTKMEGVRARSTSGIRAVVDCRASGGYRTTPGNQHVHACGWTAVAEANPGVRIHVLMQGDDSIVFTDAALHNVPEVFNQCGFEVTGGRVTPHVATYCSGLFWPIQPFTTQNGQVITICHGPLPGRTIGKTIAKLTVAGMRVTEHRARRWTKEILLSLQNSATFVPFLRALVPNLLTQLAATDATPTNMWEEQHKYSVRFPHTADENRLDQILLTRYRMTPADKQHLEAYLSQIQWRFPLVLDHPLLRHILTIDGVGEIKRPSRLSLQSAVEGWRAVRQLWDR